MKASNLAGPDAQQDASISTLDELCLAIAHQFDLLGVEKVLRRGTRSLLGAIDVEVFLVNGMTGQLVECGRNDATKDFSENVKNQFVEAAADAAKFSEQIVKHCGDTSSIVAFPLIALGDVIGAYAARFGSQTNLDVVTPQMKSVALHASSAIHKAQIVNDLWDTQQQLLVVNAGLEKKVTDRTALIAKAKREWEATFDAIDEPLAFQDGFTVRRANVAYARNIGLPITQIPGKICYQVFAKRDSPCPGCPLTKKLEDAARSEISLSNGALYSFSSFLVESEKESNSVVVHYRDITHQRRLEQRVRETDRLQAVAQLAAGAAHEINNPMAFLKANLGALIESVDELSQKLPPEGDTAKVLADGHEMLKECLDGANRVAAIVRSLRELAHESKGDARACLVNDSISRAVSAELSGHKNVSLNLTSEKEIFANPLSVDKAIREVLRNARQAVTADQRIEITSTDERTGVVVCIRDEGRGIAKEHMAHIFEPFFTTRTIGQGKGLGLTAVYGIIRQYNGDVQVESEVGKGSTFTLRFSFAPYSGEQTLK